MKRSIVILSIISMLLLGAGIGRIVMAQSLDMDNTRINTDNGSAAQYDEVVAINYQNPDNAVIVWQDMRSGYQGVAVGYTQNGGQNWTDYLLNIPPYQSLSDPSIAADSNGNFFICMLAGDTAGQNAKDIIVLRSTDGGITWSDPALAVGGSSGIHDIMPGMAIDNTPFGSRGFIYVTWVRYSDDISSSLVYCTQSSDTGRTFLPPIQVSDNPGILQWPNVNIRSAFGNGDVDVCWFRSHYPGILFDHSVTEGWTFGHDYWPTVTGAVNYEINGGILVSTIPVMAADNQNGSSGFEKAYLVYMDSSNSNWNIFCVRITSFIDNTEYIDFYWPIRLNDDPGSVADQFMPAVAVDDQGIVHVGFFDRRNDPNNLLYDVYYTSSSDFGNTWSPNVRVSNISSDPTQPGVDGQIGNRIGISAWGGHVVITWTDTRDGNSNVYVSCLQETGISEEPAPLPTGISLDNIYPNPFNSSIRISFSSNSRQRVKLDIIDLGGRHVTSLFDGSCQTGTNSIIWNGQSEGGHDVSTGIYFVRLISNNQAIYRKAVLLR